MKPGLGRHRHSKSGMKLGPAEAVWYVAVVKVPPPIGSVKYKAQHVVLLSRIPVLTRDEWAEAAKITGIGCGIFTKGAKVAGFTGQ